MKLSKKDLFDIPVIALLAANTVPLFGVLFLQRDAFYVVLLYWAENLVIGCEAAQSQSSQSSQNLI